MEYKTLFTLVIRYEVHGDTLASNEYPNILSWRVIDKELEHCLHFEVFEQGGLLRHVCTISKRDFVCAYLKEMEGDFASDISAEAELIKASLPTSVITELQESD